MLLHLLNLLPERRCTLHQLHTLLVMVVPRIRVCFNTPRHISSSTDPAPNGSPSPLSRALDYTHSPFLRAWYHDHALRYAMPSCLQTWRSWYLPSKTASYSSHWRGTRFRPHLHPENIFASERPQIPHLLCWCCLWVCCCVCRGSVWLRWRTRELARVKERL